MDPNETLAALRRDVVNLRRYLGEEDSFARLGAIETLATDVAEHVAALDEWLSKGGFPPGAWVELMKRAAAVAEALAHPVTDRDGVDE